MTTHPPSVEVEIVDKGDGAWALIVNGTDLAMVCDSWKLEPTGFYKGDPKANLTLVIPCESLTLRSEEPR